MNSDIVCASVESGCFVCDDICHIRSLSMAPPKIPHYGSYPSGTAWRSKNGSAQSWPFCEYRTRDRRWSRQSHFGDEAVWFRFPQSAFAACRNIEHRDLARQHIRGKRCEWPYRLHAFDARVRRPWTRSSPTGAYVWGVGSLLEPLATDLCSQFAVRFCELLPQNRVVRQQETPCSRIAEQHDAIAVQPTAS